MIATVLRLVIAGWILVTLVRAGQTAWRHRELVVAIWRGWRPVHLAGVVGLFVVVAGTAGVLITFVPFMDVGLGMFVGTESNAVFSPLEAAVASTGPAPATGPDWALVLLSSAFLLPLLLVLPWLAFLEEEVFRAGIESQRLGGQVRWALVFGLAHLVMLVPVGAALAVGLAGFVYGRVYRWGQATDAPMPAVALRTYRPSKRAARAVQERIDLPVGGGSTEAATRLAIRSEAEAHRRQAAGVFHATLWHAAFNSALVAAVWLSFVLVGLLG